MSNALTQHDPIMQSYKKRRLAEEAERQREKRRQEREKQKKAKELEKEAAKTNK
ncbi:hypothetical protein GE21DRAFT_1337987 [Neurospora crassa]|nr:hypothetical protein GE21DRAFT_1337987 [Neurospora crassa]